MVFKDNGFAKYGLLFSRCLCFPHVCATIWCFSRPLLFLISCLLVIYLPTCQAQGRINIKVLMNYSALLYVQVNIDSCIRNSLYPQLKVFVGFSLLGSSFIYRMHVCFSANNNACAHLLIESLKPIVPPSLLLLCVARFKVF